MDNSKSFTYLSNTEDFHPQPDATLAFIPIGITQKHDLLATLKEQLRFPYFGNNWDSLDELLRDFSWLQSRQVAIVHQELPALNERDTRIYLEILRDDLKVLASRKSHELVIIFPSALQEQIESILQ